MMWVFFSTVPNDCLNDAVVENSFYLQNISFSQITKNSKNDSVNCTVECTLYGNVTQLTFKENTKVVGDTILGRIFFTNEDRKLGKKSVC